MIASLPMYDWPELSGATDNFWQTLSDHLRAIGLDAPKQLSRSDDDEAFWLDPDLLIGQTCGYPFSTILRDKVQYLTTPIYNVEGCSGPYYSSAIVAHKDNDVSLDNFANSCFANSCFAYNATLSQSGFRCVKEMFGDPLTYFASMKESGGHRFSARMVAQGHADVAALDAVCWHLLQIHEPQTAEKLRLVAWTEKRPALPLITSLRTSAETIEKMRASLANCVAPDELAIAGYQEIDLAQYHALARF